MSSAPTLHAQPALSGDRVNTGLRDLWRRRDGADLPSPTALRIACALLFGTYAMLGIARHVPGQVICDAIRGALCFWGAVGVVAARRFTPRLFGAYTIVLAVLMSVGTGIINAVLGNPPGLLPLSGLASFVPMIFLQTGRDVGLTAALVLAGNALVLWLLPPAQESRVVIATMIGGATVAGAACGLIILTYRTLLERSNRWWREAGERERVLRELAEVSTRTATEADLLPLLPERFLHAFGSGRCVVLLRDAEGSLAENPFRVVALAGLPDEAARIVSTQTTSLAGAELIDGLIRSGRPFVREHLDEEEERELRAKASDPLPARAVVALPLMVTGVVAGAIVLIDTVPRTLGSDLVDLLEAMARQAGAALARARLYERQRRLVLDLEEARQRAEAASRAKSSFLANMSHEIRTPMNGVLGALDLLLGDELRPGAREYAETARQSAQTLLTILNDILDFSRIEAGRLVLESADFELESVLEHSTRIVSSLAHAKGLRVSCSVGPGVPAFVCGDSLRLRQVLVNLLSNAIKFTDEGEIHVSVSRCDAADCEAEKTVTLRFEVSDTGIGIAHDRLGVIFESFSQADGSTTRRYGGTGLGLAISRELVTLMRGEIGVESVLGKGSTFWFTVRLSPGTKRTADEPALVRELPEKPGQGLHVLLAEDNAVNQRVVVRILERLGCRVDLACNGHEAVVATRTRRYDLVLMDQHMPEMDGIEATREIRQQEGTRTPIVALTASILQEDRERCFAAGMDDFLAKPIGSDDLRALLDRTARTRSPS